MRTTTTVTIGTLAGNAMYQIPTSIEEALSIRTDQIVSSTLVSSSGGGDGHYDFSESTYEVTYEDEG